MPLTWWQKFLKALGLYDPSKRTSPSRVPKPAEPAATAGAGKPKRKPRQGERKSGGGSKPQGGDASEVESRRLYLGNLSYEVTEYELQDLFKGIGPVREIEIVYNRNTHKSKGYGFAEMQTIEDAKRAVEVLHDQPFMGRNLIVSGAKSQGPKDSDESEESGES